MEPMHTLLKPVSYDKGGANYSIESVNDLCFKMIKAEMYFGRRMRMTTKDLDSATNQLNDATENFNTALDSFIAAESTLGTKTKNISGKIKDSAQKLNDGLARMEGLANFDRFERYVGLLERAEKAMGALAVLEQTGKLDKIVAALK